jgi:carbon storage regulator
MMLVITRRVGEEIVIAGSIRVKVVTVEGRTTRQGISAPSSVPVVRRELLAEYPAGARSLVTGRPGKLPETGCASTESAS